MTRCRWGLSIACAALALGWSHAVSAADMAVSQYGRVTATLPWAVAIEKGFFAAEGVKVDHIDENVERIAAEESFDTPTGHIAAGTIAAMRSTLTGYVDGTPTFVIDHVTRMHDDIAPDWPQPRISIEPVRRTSAAS